MPIFEATVVPSSTLSLPIFCEQTCAMIIDAFGSDDSLANTKTLMTAFSSVMYQNLMVPDVFDAFKVH